MSLVKGTRGGMSTDCLKNSFILYFLRQKIDYPKITEYPILGKSAVWRGRVLAEHCQAARSHEVVSRGYFPW